MLLCVVPMAVFGYQNLKEAHFKKLCMIFRDRFCALLLTEIWHQTSFDPDLNDCKAFTSCQVLQHPKPKLDLLETMLLEDTFGWSVDWTAFSQILPME